MSYEDYDQKCNEIRMRNEVYLKEFREDLIKSGLKEKTIENHCQNVEFYINTYLLRQAPQEMKSGTDSISGFLGNFFIRKCTWSSPNSIKGNATSIKKFYKSMLQRGYINEEDYGTLVEIIKDEMDDWLQEWKLLFN